MVFDRVDGVEHYCSVRSCTDVKLALLHTPPWREGWREKEGLKKKKRNYKAKTCDSVL